MAAKKKASAKKSTVLAALKEVQEQHGKNVAIIGPHWDNTERAFTACFPVDYATGGGFPRGRISVVYGHEGSGKTTLALLAIAAHQRSNPELTNIFIDVEGTFDPAHGVMLGVDVSKLVHVVPDYAEQVVDIAERFLYAEDCGILAVDSLAAMITTNEIDSSAVKAVVGGSGLVIGKLYRKVTRALNVARQKNYKPTIIAINQIRYKIGMMFGNPETQPGGKSFMFASSLTIRCTGKDVKDAQLDPDKPVWREINIIIQKHKIPILAREAEYRLAIADTKIFKCGYINDWKYLKARLLDNKLLVSLKGAKWGCCGYEFDNQAAVRNQLKNDPDFYKIVCDQVMGKALEGVAMEEDYEEDEEGVNDEEFIEDDEIPF